jgi:HlyD family secretion protein
VTRPFDEAVGSTGAGSALAIPALRARRWTLQATCALVAMLLGWSFVARLDIVASAPARLVPTSQVKTVQAGDAGIVREILIGEGEHVQAGQVLLRLDSTVAAADRQQVADELRRLRLTMRAIDAELADRALDAVRGDPPQIAASIRAQFAARRQAHEDALAHERQAEERARNERLAAERQRDKLRETLPGYRLAAESFERLQRDGFIGELAANDRRREAIERERDLAAQEATVEALGSALAQIGARQRQLRSNHRAELLRERGELVAAVQRLQHDQAKAGFRTALLEVPAPQEGVVKDLVVHAAGAVVQAGAALLRVVPFGDLLVAEAMLANEDVGFAEVGQAARVKLVAYPFQKYGMLAGRLARISADALDAADAQRTPGTAVPPTYRAVIELESQQLELADGRRLELAPGMAATVEIHQGRRTVMEYLLSPVQRVVLEAGRER